MPVISAHVVRQPRKEWGCCQCDKLPDRAPHIVAFGYGEHGDTPYRIRVCLPCASNTRGDTSLFLVAMKYIGEARNKETK